jgi:hypothetical protein
LHEADLDAPGLGQPVAIGGIVATQSLGLFCTVALDLLWRVPLYGCVILVSESRTLDLDFWRPGRAVQSPYKGSAWTRLMDDRQCRHHRVVVSQCGHESQEGSDLTWTV